MAIPRILPAALGAVAILPTTAVAVLHIILAQSIADSASSVRITATIAASSEAVVLVGVSCFSYSHLATRSQIAHLRRLNGICFGAALFLCVIAAAVSVASLICLSRAADDLLSTILGSGATNFLVGTSVALGLAFATQLIFLVSHFVVGRMQSGGEKSSLHVDEERNRSHERIKAIAYHHTSTAPSKTMSIDSRTPPGSSSGRSATETMSSIRSSLSNVVRPISSKTRLLSGSQRSSRRPASLEVASLHEHRPRSNEDGFDSWDTSGVDPQNRQTVLETSSPPLPLGGRFLETIPASPTTSRSPSPGTPLDLEPPRTRRRSRSYSPASTSSKQQRPAFTQQSNQSESHIHPLFRSDSPTPPPLATPGTIVMAAPGAGQIISDRQSIRSMRSLTRMRSGSLPAVPSPLSRQGSLESFHKRAESSSPEIREEDETAQEAEERKMTPPIPDWILSAGCRTSLTGYNSRKLRTPGGEEETSSQL
ncbi:hypothetical protein B0H63DRAFT_267491 [Podospora didyma]|uniref:Uncharacterized protein n=1 Tax=Podospora didyma TaxID=330526 RepID=A0AAE0N9E2_9PEZI|nr:hypothetical protein B0H63DRAFT_267491 [Podospora didyma]